VDYKLVCVLKKVNVVLLDLRETTIRVVHVMIASTIRWDHRHEVGQLRTTAPCNTLLAHNRCHDFLLEATVFAQQLDFVFVRSSKPVKMMPEPIAVTRSTRSTYVRQAHAVSRSCLTSNLVHAEPIPCRQLFGMSPSSPASDITLTDKVANETEINSDLLMLSQLVRGHWRRGKPSPPKQQNFPFIRSE
jgi:hypothetical protein